REVAFRRVAAMRGLHIPDRFVSHDLMSEEHAFVHATEMLPGRLGPSPTAFLRSSTLQALGVIRAAGAAGLVIGTDLSIIAHDDVLPHLRPENFNPPLTVTRSPIRMAGAALAEMMGARISGVDPLQLQRMVSADLIVR